MKDILFSIIVPIYNIEVYLTDCIDSILQQTYENFEVILVDDGSTDSCSLICDKYALSDNRVKVIHKQNGGLVETRKTGVDAAHGNYVVCVDGDDWIENTYLENMIEVIVKFEPDIICCGYYKANGKQFTEAKFSVPTGYYEKDKIKKIIFPTLIEDEKGNYFSPQIWAKTYKLSLYKQQQQQVDGLVSVGEDHACTKPCIFHSNSIFIMDKCLYYYRLNPESMTKKPKAFIWEGPKAIGEHFEKQIDMTQFDFQHQVYRNVVHNLFNVAVSQWNRDEAYKIIKKDILTNIADEYYQRCIKNCYYKGMVKGQCALFILKHKSVFLLYVFNRIQRRKY